MSNTSAIAIKNAILVNAKGMRRSDILVRHGVVEEIASSGSQWQTERVIDASGKFVLPGIIDAHVHPVYADRIDTLSKAAAVEGVTTLIAYVGAVKAWGETKGLISAIDDFIREGEGAAVVDFGVHCTLLQEDIKEAHTSIPQLVEKGIISFKGFMAYAKRGMKLEDDELIHIMKIIAAQNGLLVVHAENGTVIDFMEEGLTSQGKRAPEYYPPSHPGLCEAEAIFRLLTLGKVTDCPIYVPHISAWESLEVIRFFKNWGGPEFYTETCPHYLTLTDEEMSKRGTIAKMAPPLRKEKDLEELWRAVQEGVIDVIASDTAGQTIQSNEPLWDDVFKAPNGIPGVDTLFKVTYDEGVNKGRITLPALVEKLCENPAKAFGLYPRKGVLKPGADADMVVFDPSVEHTIPKKHHLLNVDYSLFEGRKCLGAPVLVMQRGEILAEDGELKARPGRGMYIPRKR